ncbi:MAG: GNAT family N-acetyltransferase, partial [Spirochaetaceae bacterium]|nr:GNAT family N-acetyltransferase [Spirochaetaceae bacterium]
RLIDSEAMEYDSLRAMGYEVLNNSSLVTGILAEDPFSNLVTLKMLELYPRSCSTVLYRCGREWACRTELIAKESHWDRKAYPETDLIIMLDGNSSHLLRRMAETLPASRIVLKVHDKWSRRHFQQSPRFRLVQSFISYTTTADSLPDSLPGTNPVTRHCHYSDEATPLFAQNGYSPDELQGHLSRGARWFATRESGRLVSIALVFPNYHDIWEIGGVYTLPVYRRNGYAALVVQAALQYLVQRGLRPRYQFHQRNIASQALAERLGLDHVLTVDHFAPL